MIRIDLDKSWRLTATGTIDVPVAAAAVWAQMRDVERFLTADPLHAAISFDSLPEPARSFQGASVRIKHRLFGLGPDRVGRILKWREGCGYVVSDLSRRGPREGFPHVCSVEVIPLAPELSRIVVGARGKWTATWIPRPFVRLWIWWVLRCTEPRIIARILFGAARQGRRG